MAFPVSRQRNVSSTRPAHDYYCSRFGTSLMESIPLSWRNPRFFSGLAHAWKRSFQCSLPPIIRSAKNSKRVTFIPPACPACPACSDVFCQGVLPAPRSGSIGILRGTGRLPGAARVLCSSVIGPPGKLPGPNCSSFVPQNNYPAGPSKSLPVLGEK
jgi:hypothetical protein